MHLVDKRQKPLEISQAAFSRARNNLNLSLEELAQMACLSTHQIKQIESGGHSTFYSPEIKITAAKKVAHLLGIKEEDVFDHDELENVLVVDTQIDSSEAELEKISVDAMLLSRQPKRTSLKKKVLSSVILVVLATFSFVALRTIFFQQSTQEIVLIEEKDAVSSASPAAGNVSAPAQTQEGVATPNPLASQESLNQVAPAPETVLLTPASSGNTCPVADEQISIYRTGSPRKAGNMVYVQAKKGQIVCVEDAAGKIQQKSLDAGIGASFYGRPPFKLMTTDLSQVDIFFQGMRVYPENPQGRTLVLESVDVVRPVNNTDSGMR
jgi:cytoskeleton protein RodZ